MSSDETEDGSDPRRFFDRRRRHGRPSGPGRKALQLAAQAKDAVTAALAGCADAGLRELMVVSVRPAPHSGRLLVTVAAPPADVTDRAAVLEQLRRAAGYLRAAVAAAVNRRKAPELAFELG